MAGTPEQPRYPDPNLPQNHFRGDCSSVFGVLVSRLPYWGCLSGLYPFHEVSAGMLGVASGTA